MCFNNSFKSQPVMRQSLHLSLCIFSFFCLKFSDHTHLQISAYTSVKFCLWECECRWYNAVAVIKRAAEGQKPVERSKHKCNSVFLFQAGLSWCLLSTSSLLWQNKKNTIILFSQYQQIIFKWQECCGHALHKITIIITYLSYYHMCLIDTISILKF